MKLEVKYLFLTLSSAVHFYICQLPEEMRKILAHGIMVQMNPKTSLDIFWIFVDFLGDMRVTPTKKFHQWRR